MVESTASSVVAYRPLAGVRSAVAELSASYALESSILAVVGSSDLGFLGITLSVSEVSDWVLPGLILSQLSFHVLSVSSLQTWRENVEY